MHKNYSVLIVEDNNELAGQLGDYLTGRGFIIDFACDGRTAINLLSDHKFDVVVLDLMLPDIDGLSVCQYIKQKLTIVIPVLMLTARDSLTEKLAGFGVGADDYLTKPFALEEVHVRCLALAKRKELHQSNCISIGDMIIDFSKHIVKRAGIELSLSSTDFSILKVLAEAYPDAVNKRHLAEAVWGDNLPETDAVRSHIYTLRNVLDKPFSYPLIKTIHGIGFKLEHTDDNT